MDIFRTVSKAFLYFISAASVCLGVVFSLYSGSLVKGISFSLFGGFVFAAIMSCYLLIVLSFFKKKIIFYSNMPKQLQTYNIRNIFHESVAGNATSGRIKYGGLFLSDNYVMFIPHRFAIKPMLIEIPIRGIKQVKKSGVNLLKSFSGGLRNRLIIEMMNGERYEFSVWDTDIWTEKIDGMLKNLKDKALT